MCMVCARSGLRLRDAGYSADFTNLFLWHFTPFPVGDGAYVRKQVRRFLSVKRSRRLRWMRKQDHRMDREIAERCWR